MAVSVLSLRRDLRCCQFGVSNLGDRSPGQHCIWYSASTPLHLQHLQTPTVIQPQAKVLIGTDHAVKEPQEEPQSWRSEAGRSADLCCGVAPSWPSAATQPQVLCHISSYIRGLLKLCFTYDINLIMSQVSREHQSLYRYTEVDNKISRSWKNI